jgi:hypothetical protein
VEQSCENMESEFPAVLCNNKHLYLVANQEDEGAAPSELVINLTYDNLVPQAASNFLQDYETCCATNYNKSSKAILSGL